MPMLTARDKAIIKDLNRFRVMDRDSIAELHFAGLKNPCYSANNVLLRLLRDGQISRSTSFVPYVYFPAEATVKVNSSKIPHFLAILDVYKEMRKLGALEHFRVEPKYGRKSEAAEPDIYAFFRRTPFFIEVQRTAYSEKQMAAKMERYIDLYNSGLIAKPFPHVLILSDQRYALDGADYPFRLFQAESFGAFMAKLQRQQVSAPEPAKVGGGIKVRIT